MPTAFVGGLVVASAVWLTVFLVLQTANTTQIRGGVDSEALTARALRPLTRRGYVHRDHVPIPHQSSRGSGPRAWSDVDHLVVGVDRAWALETKWRSGGWGEDDLAGPAAQARDAARAAGHLLRSLKHGVPVEPVVVVWGRLAPGLELPRRVGDVQVLHGSGLARWRGERDRVPSEEREAMDAVASGLDRALVQRDQASTAGAEPGAFYVRTGPAALFDRMAWVLIVGAGAFVAAVLIVALRS